MKKVTDDIESILKNKQREKSDLQNMNAKLVAGVEHLSKQVQEVNESIESICTITLCLVESQCMQIRAEEQDDIDKQNIALMGVSKSGMPSGIQSVPESFDGTTVTNAQNEISHIFSGRQSPNAGVVTHTI